MGMFTTILHGGHEYQIKTGFDYCDTYQVGDTVDWKPDDRWPGSHIDGVYDDAHCKVWVVIKDRQVVAVEPRTDNVDTDWHADRPVLEAKYGITDPPHDLWPESAWKAQADAEARHQAEYAAWVKIHGDNPAGFYIHKRLQEKSFLSRILPARRVE